MLLSRTSSAVTVAVVCAALLVGAGGCKKENKSKLPGLGPDTGRVIINEIMPDPGTALDLNGDGTMSSTQDEYIEIVNVSGTNFDIGEWQIHDAGQLRFTFPANTTLQAGKAAVVFGGGTPASFTGFSSNVQLFSAGGLGLNNDTDAITLVKPTSSGSGPQTISKVIYPNPTATTDAPVSAAPAKGKSLNRTTDLNASAAFDLHDTVHAAKAYSPGQTAAGNPF